MKEALEINNGNENLEKIIESFYKTIDKFNIITIYSITKWNTS